jgi:hypothetical protein
MAKKIIFAVIVVLLIAVAVFRLAPRALLANAQPPVETPVVAGPGPDSSGKITLDQNHQTIQVKVGQSVLVALGDGDWTLQVSDPSVLQRVKGVMLVRGAQGLFDVMQAGQTKVSAQNGATQFEVILIAR